MVVRGHLGELEYVDEFGTPFWSNVSYVLLKRTHPLLTCVSPVAEGEAGALCELKRAFETSRVSLSLLPDENQRAMLAGIPLRVSKAMYEAAKSEAAW